MGTSGIADGGPTAVAATAIPRGVEGLPLSQLRIINLVHEHANTVLLFLEEKMFFILIRQHSHYNHAGTVSNKTAPVTPILPY